MRYAAAPHPVADGSSSAYPSSSSVQQPVVRPFCVVVCLRLVRANLVAVVAHAAAVKKRGRSGAAKGAKESEGVSGEEDSSAVLLPSSETIHAVHLELTRLVRRPPEFHDEASGSAAVAEEAARGLVVGLSLFRTSIIVLWELKKSSPNPDAWESSTTTPRRRSVK